MVRIIPITVALLLSLNYVAVAQHEHHTVEPANAVSVSEEPDPQVVEVDTEANHEHADTHGEEHVGHAGHVSLLGFGHGRHGSGTSWMPDSTPAYAWMREAGGWNWMFHGTAHAAYIDMSGPRGDSGLFAPNWAMARGSQRYGCNGEWDVSAMVSLDPLTVGGAGYPLLFQTGESWQGQPLRDHQHPHNYFMELSAKYTSQLDCDSAVYVYLAPVGEPALGPPAFMHRTIALDYPLSPISHHWQDSSHITYGVATVGVQSREWQVEGSVFNGAEPGENRAEIQSPTFDSYSGRVTWNPGKNVSLQVSQGQLKEPEALHPGVDVRRTTASLIYNHDLGCERNWQTALVWGRNHLEGADFDSYLMETALKQDGGWSPYLRLEQVEKSAEELVLPASFDPDDRFTLRQGAVGFTVDLNDDGDWLWGIGGAYVLNLSQTALDPVYGANPSGWLVYLRAHPRRAGNMESQPDGESHH